MHFTFDESKGDEQHLTTWRGYVWGERIMISCFPVISSWLNWWKLLFSSTSTRRGTIPRRCLLCSGQWRRIYGLGSLPGWYFVKRVSYALDSYFWLVALPVSAIFHFFKEKRGLGNEGERCERRFWGFATVLGYTRVWGGSWRPEGDAFSLTCFFNCTLSFLHELFIYFIFVPSFNYISVSNANIFFFSIASP